MRGGSGALYEQGSETQVMGTFSHLGCPLVKKCELSKQWRDYWCSAGASGTEEAREEPPHLAAVMQSWKDNLVCTLRRLWWVVAA